MTWRVLVSAPYLQPVLGEYQKVFDKNCIEVVVPPVRERLNEVQLLQWIGDIDGVICGDDQFTERVLRMAPRLRVISKWGTGIDSIDLRAAAELGVQVCSTPNAFTDPVADTVLGYILCLARQLPWMDRDIRKGLWSKRTSVSLRECTLGVIGVGNVGKAVIRRAMVFGMVVLGHDIVEIPAAFVAETGLQVVPKQELLRQADVVSVNCDLNPTSFDLMSKLEFQLMKPSSYLINTARGPIVDEPMLVQALQERRLGGAALDVFEVEPLPDDSPLRGMDNVLLAPHSSNGSPKAWKRVHENTIRNLIEGLLK